jgi:hypothetical protein
LQLRNRQPLGLWAEFQLRLIAAHIAVHARLGTYAQTIKHLRTQTLLCKHTILRFLNLHATPLPSSIVNYEAILEQG